MKHLELFPDGFDSSLTEKVKAENWPFVGHDVVTGEVVYSNLLVEPQQLYYIYYTTADNTPINIPTKEYYEECPEVPAVIDQIVYNTYENGLGVIALNSPVLVKNMATDWWFGFGGLSIFDDTNITSVTFPSITVEDDQINYGTFDGCTSLHTINLPMNITVIGADAFRGCTTLESFEVPSGCVLIGSPLMVWLDTYDMIGSFQACTSLKSIIIPNSVKLIGAGCFKDCPMLTEITFTGTQDEWNSIEKTFSGTNLDLGDEYTINWNDESSITIVHCTDGDITL